MVTLQTRNECKGKAPMRIVVRDPRWRRRDAYGFWFPETYVREGEVVPTPKWAEPGTICLTTGDERFPVRMIAPDMIVSIDDVVANNKPVDTKVLVVPGSKGASYTVTRSPTGTTCTCAGFGFRKSCKHISLEF
jgi:hypothetical protein